MADCSSRFESQHLHGNLQPSATPVPEDPIPSGSGEIAYSWYTDISIRKTPPYT